MVSAKEKITKQQSAEVMSGGCHFRKAGQAALSVKVTLEKSSSSSSVSGCDITRRFVSV